MSTMRRIAAAVLIMGLGVVALGQGGEGAATSTAPATMPTAVTLKGVITTRDEVVRVAAVDRLWADVLKVSTDEMKDPFVYAGTVDGKTGAFSVEKLLPGRTYDLVVFTKGKDGGAGDVRWEGVTLDFHRPVTPDKDVTAEDKAWLKEFIEKTSVGKSGDDKDTSFYDQGKILWMAADHKHATLLVELVRDREFHSGGRGEIIYRTELWYFENLFGGWAKDKNTERVVTRVRGQAGAIRQNWQYVPALGGIAIPMDGKAEEVKVTLPEKADRKRGLAGGLGK